MKWSIHDLAPVCPVPTCSRYGTRHLLTHQEEIATQILTGAENYIYWQGGVGSAKTLLWGVLAAAFALIVPNSRSILFRKDYGLNYETLWRYFKQAIQAACDQGIIQANFNKLWSVKKQGEYTICTLPNGSVIRAGQTKNWSEFMGPSYDFILVSDAMENNNFGEIFHGEGVVGGLQSRLRGQASSFYTLPGGLHKDMRRFLVESNPPPNINELHTIFGKEPGVRALPGTAITYRHIQSSSIQNDHNPASYVAEITSQHSNPDDIRRILEGQTVAYYGGKRVVETFIPELHVAEFTCDDDLPLFVGIDPGYQHPGVTFSQIKRCSYDKEHYITLSEISNLYAKITKELVDYNKQDQLGILQHLALFYPKHFDLDAYMQVREALLKQVEYDERHLDAEVLSAHFTKVKFCRDRAGNRKYSTNKDRETDALILWRHYGIQTRVKTNLSLDLSLNRVRQLFKDICICGMPVRMIDRLKAPMLIDSYAGGYRYPKLNTGVYGDEPVKDHYKDLPDADRYSLENFFFTPYIEEASVAKPLYTEEDIWSWMGSIPQERRR